MVLVSWMCAGGVLQGLQAAPCPGADRGMPCPPTEQPAAHAGHGGSGAPDASARAAWAQRLRVVQEALTLLRLLLRDRDIGTAGSPCDFQCCELT